MYAAFLDAFPVLLSLWQAGFYQLYSVTAIKPYLDARTELLLPKEN